MIRFNAWFALWLSIVCTACAGTETGNPSFDGTLGYDAFSSAPSRLALRGASPEGDDEAPTQIDAAWFGLGEVSFLVPELCNKATGGLFPATALGLGDHVGTHAGVTRVELVDLDYCGVVVPFQFQHAVKSGAPDDIQDHSVLITGTHDGVPFRFAGNVTRVALRRFTDDEFTFELDAKHSGVVIGFDLAAVFEDFDWSTATLDDSGTLRLPNDRAPQRAFESGFARSMALYRDQNADGVIDSSNAPLTDWPE